jgi:hypothetical protein
MASSLTYLGERYALFGNGSNGSIARLATHLRLYTVAPLKDGTLVVEALGTGYAAIAISSADWTPTPTPGATRPMQIVLANQTWTAGAGGLLNISGAYITDSLGAPLGWWERSAGSISLPVGETLTTDALTIRFP